MRDLLIPKNVYRRRENQPSYVFLTKGEILYWYERQGRKCICAAQHTQKTFLYFSRCVKIWNFKQFLTIYTEFLFTIFVYIKYSIGNWNLHEIKSKNSEDVHLKPKAMLRKPEIANAKYKYSLHCIINTIYICLRITSWTGKMSV